MSTGVADFLMPSLGADMESAKVVEWLVKPGSRVKPGDLVAVVASREASLALPGLPGPVDHAVTAIVDAVEAVAGAHP
jgi:pyruvate dehydrogenase E2 component (dihydrolipoamide acetyltransferase)